MSLTPLYERGVLLLSPLQEASPGVVQPNLKNVICFSRSRLGDITYSQVLTTPLRGLLNIQTSRHARQRQEAMLSNFLYKIPDPKLVN